MSNNKQSSVEWLDEKLSGLHFEYLTGEITNSEFNERKKVLMAEAKAMHKDEIMEAHFAPKYGCFSEQYYNETFGE